MHEDLRLPSGRIRHPAGETSHAQGCSLPCGLHLSCSSALLTARADSAAERTHRSSNSTAGALEGSTPFSVCAAAPVVCASRQARSAIGMLTSWEPLSAGFTTTSMHLRPHGVRVSSVHAAPPGGHFTTGLLLSAGCVISAILGLLSEGRWHAGTGLKCMLSPERDGTFRWAGGAGHRRPSRGRCPRR